MEGSENPRSQVSSTLSSIFLSVCSLQVPDLSLLPPALSPQDLGMGMGQELGPSWEQNPSQVRPWSSGAWGSLRDSFYVDLRKSQVASRTYGQLPSLPQVLED